MKSRACKGSRLDGAWARHGGMEEAWEACVGIGIGFVGVAREGPPAEHILVGHNSWSHILRGAYTRGAIHSPPATIHNSKGTFLKIHSCQCVACVALRLLWLESWVWVFGGVEYVEYVDSVKHVENV